MNALPDINHRYMYEPRREQPCNEDEYGNPLEPPVFEMKDDLFMKKNPEASMSKDADDYVVGLATGRFK